MEQKINEFLPLREEVYLTLRRDILRGKLKPGERLMEIAIANKLGVSRTPVREAIRQLEHEGLAVMIPRRGAHVAEITRQELEDVLEVRRALEILAVSGACDRMGDDDIKRLEKAEKKFASLIAKKESDPTALAVQDEAFHDIIYKGSKNRRLVQILSNLREQMYRFRVEYMKDTDVRKGIIEEHNSIVCALKERDKGEAVRLIAEHIDNQKAAIDRQLAVIKDEVK